MWPLHSGSLCSQGAHGRSATENNSECSHNGGLLQMAGEKGQVFNSVAPKYPLLGIFE